MDAKEFLAKKLIETPGISGYEYQNSQEIANAFKPYCDEKLMVDDFYNVYGKKIGGATDRKPKIMLVPTWMRLV